MEAVMKAMEVGYLDKPYEIRSNEDGSFDFIYIEIDILRSILGKTADATTTTFHIEKTGDVYRSRDCSEYRSDDCKNMKNTKITQLDTHSIERARAFLLKTKKKKSSKNTTAKK